MAQYSTPIRADTVVEVFSEKPFMSVIGLFKVGIGAFLMVAVIIGAVRGTGAGENLLLIFAGAAALVGFGVYDLVKVADQRPQVRLSEAGLTALILGPVLVPWAAIREVEFIPAADSPAMIRFHLTPEANLPIDFNPLALGGRFQWTQGGPRFVQFDVSELQDGQSLILDAVARFAPGIPLRNVP